MKDKEAKITQHRRSWVVTTPEQGSTGTVVQEGEAGDCHWWVLCPATSTLVIDASPIHVGDGGYTNPFCSDGDACDWCEFHAAAHALILNQAADAS